MIHIKRLNFLTDHIHRVLVNVEKVGVDVVDLQAGYHITLG